MCVLPQSAWHDEEPYWSSPEQPGDTVSLKVPISNLSTVRDTVTSAEAVAARAQSTSAAYIDGDAGVSSP